MSQLNKSYKKILLLIGIFSLFSGCTRDPIKEVLNSTDGIPQQEKDRTINWYKTKPELSKQIRNTCDLDTTKYFQRDDCINAKAALNLVLIESNTDLSNNTRLSRDRKYLNEISNK
ncbi:MULTISPECIES: hypothetical protein [Acinetobacter]|uniref:hypothetical protein n=1 Tax=Acinetobacter TaxID=469 RepID=UPI001F4A4FCE|nr:hypothetical protein [Acinetobacter higginsii]